MGSINPPILDIRQSTFETSIPQQVTEGLTKDPKTLPALLFYSGDGIQHWTRHSCAPDFYPRREEINILHSEAAHMAASISQDSVVVDLGSASLDKVLPFLHALEAQQKRVHYYALDLSYPVLASTLSEIPVAQFQYVQIAALHGTFEDGLQWLHDSPEVRERPHHLLLFGLTIGNFSRPNAAAFLRNIADRALAASPAESSILLTLDSCKMPTKVLRAYTAEGVVPFALTSLSYANQLFWPGGEGRVFDEEEWYFHSEWNFALGRHEAALIPRDRDITLGPPLEQVVVRRGEKVRFGCSYKYSAAEREHLFAGAGLENVASWSAKGCDVAFYQLKMRPE
ncbi:hypothetical protein BP00DRAFT_423678 [Aspergillus indologenus CBS 114.80]|uniref:4-dimethylallyltryptophan N-methyltransferase n=1 Tax=Aspergillus indologenus CBS 114.80 TaxID=1450541 RepID=A0A2V5ICQ7_9EURO|nr:hypothetical protein BP00DRAFT_423678 [Aspergillus indologenus CBS 114.80]